MYCKQNSVAGGGGFRSNWRRSGAIGSSGIARPGWTVAVRPTDLLRRRRRAKLAAVIAAGCGGMGDGSDGDEEIGGLKGRNRWVNDGAVATTTSAKETANEAEKEGAKANSTEEA